MLITFKSKAAADVLMYKEHAKPLLDVLHKELDRGVLTPEEVPGAISTLEAYIEQNREQNRTSVVREPEPQDDDPYETEQQPAARVALSTRAFPLVEMLRLAHKTGVGVMWGV